MHLVLLSIVAVCIAGGSTQEIAIGTEYLRAHVNGSLSLEAAINAQLPILPPVGVVAVDSVSIITTTTTGTSTTTQATTKAGTKASAANAKTSTAAGATTTDKDSSESEDDKHKSYDHEHETHHDHDATITVDVHNVLDLFKQQLHETEERILAAIHHETKEHQGKKAHPAGHKDHKDHKDHKEHPAGHKGHKDQSSTAVPIVKSYRIADR